MNRQRLKNDQDLEKARKNNRFQREQHLHNTIHCIHIGIVKCAPFAFLILFFIALVEPSGVNMDLINKALYGVGGALASTLLSRTQEQTI